MKPLVIVGDEAWTAEEYEAEQARRERHRNLSPEARKRQAENHRRWVEANRDRVRTYKADWQRHKRMSERLRREAEVGAVRGVASLHDLACTGPTQATGCVCYRKGQRKILIVERVA